MTTSTSTRTSRDAGAGAPGPEVVDALAGWATSLRWTDLSAPQVAVVLDTLVDTVGVALAGRAAPAFAPVLTAADRLGWLAPGPAQVWGSGEPVTAPGAALLNATAAHLLDFDDVHHLLHGHPSTVLWPALVAVAQEDAVPGTRLLEGYVAGVGTMAAVARLFGPRHYSVGWHSTSTVGAIGAAAGVAVASGLSRDGVHDAIATAVSMASGVRANFGTVLKPLHAGLAARSAVEATRLVQAGVVPSPAALTGPLGAVAVFGDGSWPGSRSAGDLVAAVVDDARHGLDELGLKPYPACRGAHYAIDAALEVRSALAPEDVVAEVVVEVPLGARTALLHDDPRDGLQARFSLPYAVAVSLAHGWPQLEHFTDDAVHDDHTRHLMALLRVEEDDSAGDLSASMEGRYARVVVRTADGREVSARVDDARGSWSRPLTSREVDEKFRSTAGELLADEDVDALLTRLRRSPGDLDLRFSWALRGR